MLFEHRAFTGIKIIASTVCLFTREGTCIYCPTENKEPVLVPGCSISTTLLSSSIAETSSSRETKNGPACSPTTGLKLDHYCLTFFFCLQHSTMEERSPSALPTSFIALTSLERAPEILLRDVAVSDLSLCDLAEENYS